MTTATAATHLPRWKYVLFWVILAAVVLGTLELASRWYLKHFEGYDGNHLLQYEFDAYKNVLPTRNYVDTRGVRHNAQGFRRQSEVSPQKPPNTYRIFLMGGSTAYGTGGLFRIQRDFAVLRDSETIAAILERELAASLPGTRVEVINAAISSTWTHHHLIYLNQRILSYHPDMVLFLDGFNDFYFYEKDHDQFASYSYQEHSHVIMGDPTLYSLVYMDGWWLFRKSAFVNVTTRALRALKWRFASRREERRPIDVEQSLAGLRQVFPRNALKMQRRIGLILRDEGVTAVFMLQPMLILERGRKPMQPMEQQLFDYDVGYWAPNYEAFMHQAVPYVRDQEEAMAREVGARFIDLTEIYGGVREQIYTDYCHLTPLGNALLARYIEPRIMTWIRAAPARKSVAATKPSPPSR